MGDNDSRSIVDKALLGLLTIVFVTLKLMKVIAWSWLWALSPLWIPVAIVLAAAAGALLIGAVQILWHKAKESRAKARTALDDRKTEEER